MNYKPTSARKAIVVVLGMHGAPIGRAKLLRALVGLPYSVSDGQVDQSLFMLRHYELVETSRVCCEECTCAKTVYGLTCKGKLYLKELVDNKVSV